MLCLLLRISPSEGDSIGSDPPSYRGSPQEGIRPAGLPIDPKQPHKPAINGLNGRFAHILTVAIQSYIDIAILFLILLNCREIESGPMYLTHLQLCPM